MTIAEITGNIGVLDYDTIDERIEEMVGGGSCLLSRGPAMTRSASPPPSGCERQSLPWPLQRAKSSGTP
jgi:hypothetical protein